MKGSDDFRNSTNTKDDLAPLTTNKIFGSSIVAFRMKTLFNLMTHLVFAGLYAFEHNNQVVLYTNAISSDNTPVGNVIVAQESAVEVVYTPGGNIVIMIVNILLALLTLQISINVDSQIEHIQVPTYMS